MVKAKDKTIRLFIVDDHILVRAGLQNLFEDQEDIQLVGEADNGQDAIDMALELRPDVLLVDIRLPDISGIEVVRRIKETAPGREMEALMLTVYDDLDVAINAIKAGAIGYILKDCAKEDLVAAVRKASAGEPQLSPEIAMKILSLLRSEGEERLVESLWGSTGRAAESDEERPALTTREWEVLRLLAKGYSNKAIAKALFITESTVKVHTKNIYRKLGTEDRSSAIFLSMKKGWV